MNLKPFLVDALGQALALGIGTPDDVLRHVTPDVLAAHLPRPLWARLIAACLGAPRVDARLVVETIGVPNLCEHVPSTIVWACIAELGARSLGASFTASAPGIAAAPSVAAPAVAAPAIAAQSVATPVAATPAPIAASGTGPMSVVIPPRRPTPPSGVLVPPPPAAVEAAPAAKAEKPSLPPVAPVEKDGDTERPRVVSPQRFRQSNTGIGRGNNIAAQPRRPMAAAAAPTTPPAAPAPAKRRAPTDAEVDVELDSDWKPREIAVDDSQLVEWAEPTRTSDDDFSDLGRKR